MASSASDATGRRPGDRLISRLPSPNATVGRRPAGRPVTAVARMSDSLARPGTWPVSAMVACHGGYERTSRSSGRNTKTGAVPVGARHVGAPIVVQWDVQIRAGRLTGAGDETLRTNLRTESAAMTVPPSPRRTTDAPASVPAAAIARVAQRQSPRALDCDEPGHRRGGQTGTAASARPAYRATWHRGDRRQASRSACRRRSLVVDRRSGGLSASSPLQSALQRRANGKSAAVFLSATTCPPTQVAMAATRWSSELNLAGGSGGQRRNLSRHAVDWAPGWPSARPSRSDWASG